jgi:predicted protein tyrosine phosphatase
MMHPVSIHMLTICGIEELPGHRGRSVSHVLSIIDPDCPDPEAFSAYDPHHRTLLRFNDIIDPLPGQVMPRPEHVEAVLAFGEDLARSRDERAEGHLLVHCHMGISRSTAAMAMLMAQTHPDESEDALFLRLAEIRPQAWPNSVMIAFADEMLGRKGRLTDALRHHYGRRVRQEPAFAEAMKRLGRGREVEMAVDR